jgi:hypothetical protein
MVVFISGELNEMWCEIFESRYLNLNMATMSFQFEQGIM